MGAQGWHGLRGCTAGLGAGHERWDGGCQRAHQKRRPQATLAAESQGSAEEPRLCGRRVDTSGCNTGGKTRHFYFEHENCLLQYVQKIKEFEIIFFLN